MILSKVTCNLSKETYNLSKETCNLSKHNSGAVRLDIQKTPGAHRVNSRKK